MSIEEVEIDFSVSNCPSAVRRVIDESYLHWKEFAGRKDAQRFPNLIPSDAMVVFSVINAVTQQGLPPGQVFCEWGSGFGTGACLAALLGYQSFGIEIQPELAAISRDLVRRFQVPVEILCTSYIPDGFESVSGVGGIDLVRLDRHEMTEDEEETSWSDDVELETTAVDLFFVYPWPDEQDMMRKLFDAVAAEGAILISYHCAEEICVFRKCFEPRDDSE